MLFFLFETLSFGIRLEQLRVKLNFSSCFYVDCISRSGGLAIFWNVNNNCSTVGYSLNHIDLSVTGSNGDWRLTGFYSFPERSRRNFS